MRMAKRKEGRKCRHFINVLQVGSRPDRKSDAVRIGYCTTIFYAKKDEGRHDGYTRMAVKSSFLIYDSGID